MGYEGIKQSLRGVRDLARKDFPTDPDHAIKNHRADELVRDLLDDVLYEPADDDLDLRVDPWKGLDT